MWLCPIVCFPLHQRSEIPLETRNRDTSSVRVGPGSCPSGIQSPTGLGDAGAQGGPPPWASPGRGLRGSGALPCADPSAPWAPPAADGRWPMSPPIWGGCRFQHSGGRRGRGRPWPADKEPPPPTASCGSRLPASSLQHPLSRALRASQEAPSGRVAVGTGEQPRTAQGPGLPPSKRAAGSLQ